MLTNLRDLQILCGKEGALILQLFKTKPVIVVIGIVGLEMIDKGLQLVIIWPNVSGGRLSVFPGVPTGFE